MNDCKRSVLEAWKAFGSGDRARIEACFTPDAEWLAPPGNATAVALGWTHHMVGPAGIADFLVDAFPRLFVAEVHVDILRVLAEGRTVVLEERMRARLANGRPYENDYCFLFELAEDGRIRRIREHMDTRRGHQCVFGDGPPGPVPGLSRS